MILLYEECILHDSVVCNWLYHSLAGVYYILHVYITANLLTWVMLLVCVICLICLRWWAISEFVTFFRYFVLIIYIIVMSKRSHALN